MTETVEFGHVGQQACDGGVVFHIESAILVRIGRVDGLLPDRSLRSERKLRIAPHSRFAQVPKRLAGSKTIKVTFFLEAVPTAIASAQSENS